MLWNLDFLAIQHPDLQPWATLARVSFSLCSPSFPVPRASCHGASREPFNGAVSARSTAPMRSRKPQNTMKLPLSLRRRSSLGWNTMEYLVKLHTHCVVEQRCQLAFVLLPKSLLCVWLCALPNYPTPCSLHLNSLFSVHVFPHLVCCTPDFCPVLRFKTFCLSLTFLENSTSC